VAAYWHIMRFAADAAVTGRMRFAMACAAVPGVARRCLLPRACSACAAAYAACLSPLRLCSPRHRLLYTTSMPFWATVLLLFCYIALALLNETVTYTRRWIRSVVFLPVALEDVNAKLPRHQEGGAVEHAG